MECYINICLHEMNIILQTNCYILFVARVFCEVKETKWGVSTVIEIANLI